ncbi:hypothetical protein [uncultured Desulfobacter sp.]|uniref:hypothetical protein n=1 Tax=uncultured Desulfobacter sp. TaxID=240139 RepID=UPI002AA6D0EF|nr:hypothetical protein [uncultured Desulfobacter sp.]
MKDEQYWNSLIEASNLFYASRKNFILQVENKIEVLKKAIKKPSERRVALELLLLLDDSIKISLLNQILSLATVGHSDIDKVREVIVTIPEKVLADALKEQFSELLRDGTDEEFRRLAELFSTLKNKEFLVRLVKEAKLHPSPDIQEVGDDFSEYIK